MGPAFSDSTGNTGHHKYHPCSRPHFPTTPTSSLPAHPIIRCFSNFQGLYLHDANLNHKCPGGSHPWLRLVVLTSSWQCQDLPRAFIHQHSGLNLCYVSALELQ